MLAPLLYMLALAGIGAAVMFSGYSQVLRSNAEMTAINAVRAQLQAAGQTLSASAVLDTPTSTIVQPPSVYSAVTVAGGSDATRLPTNYDHAGDTGTPHDVGVIDVATGVRQLDPWGKFYIYCRWENLVSTPAAPSIMVLSAGPDGTLSTKCGDTTAQGDDRIVASTVAETINRANVWQVSSSSQVKFGIDSNAVRVNQDGSMTAASLTLSGDITAANATFSGTLAAGATTFAGATITGNATVGGTLGVSGATTLSSTLSAGASTLASASVTGAATVGGTLGVTGATTLSSTLAAGASTLASAAITGAATVGSTLGVTGATALGSTLAVTGDVAVATNKFTIAAASGNTAIAGTLSAGATALSSLTLTTPLALTSGGTGAATAAGARTNLGLGTMATQNADNVAITGGSISGVDLTGSTGGTAGSVAAGNVTGCCVAVSAGGTGSGTAAGARSNLGTDNASNITSGIFDENLFPNSGVTAGTYNWGTVNSKGIVTAAMDVNTTAIQQGNTGVAVSDSGSNGTITFTNEGTTSMVIDKDGNVGIGTATPGKKLDVNGNIRIQGAAGSNRILYFATGTSDRWTVATNGTAEGGSDAGSDFVVTRYDDSGASLGAAMSIVRSTGAAAFGGSVLASGGFIGNLTGNVVGNLTGNVTGNVSGSISLSDGTAASPGIFFTSDTNTGIYRPGADVLGIAAGGQDVARFTGDTSAVNYFNIGSSLTGNPLTIAAAGTDSNVAVSLQPKGSGAVNLGSNLANYLAVTGAAASSAPRITAAGSDTDVSIALMPKGAGMVSIGTTTPTSLLTVTGSDNTGTSMVDIRNTNSGSGAWSDLRIRNDAGAGVKIGIGGSGVAVNGSDSDGGYSYLLSTSTALGLNIAAEKSTGIIKLFTGGSAATNERMRIDKDGHIGIGTTAPHSMFEVATGAFASTTSSTINALSTSGTGAITVGDTTGLTVGATYAFVVDSEIVLASVTDGTHLNVTTRGVYGTTGAAHSNGATFSTANVTVAGSSVATPNLTMLSTGGIGIGNATPSPSALMELKSTAGGLLIPRMDTTHRDAIASPATGLLIYNTSTNLFNNYNGSAWTIVGNDGTVAMSFPQGSVGSPGLYVTGDSDTGFYQASANNLSVTAGGVEVMRWNTVASGVNYFNVTPSATGTPLILGAAGSDTDVGITITPKGVGALTLTSGATTADGFTVNANSLTTGNGVNLVSTSTAGGASGASYLLKLARSGANANTAHTAYGVYSAVTNTNATSGTNVAGYFSASGATTANYGLIVAAGNVGIGSTTPVAKLDVNGAIGLTTTASAPTNGIYLPAANTFGVATNGAKAMKIGGSATALGYQAANTNDNCGGTAIGYQALYGNGGGCSNTAVGNQALYTGTANGATAVGNQALYSVNHGSNSATAVGVSALYSMSGAGASEAFGNSAAQYVTGATNVAIGASALKGASGTPISGTKNTAIGNSALTAAQTTAANNTALGQSAGSTVTTGTSNTIIGQGVASTTLATGARNILIGIDSSTDTAASSSNNTLNIGNAIYGTNLQNSTNTGGVPAIGIGTASPNASALLDVYSTAAGFLPPRMDTTHRDAISSPATGLTIYNTSTNLLNVYNGSSWAIVGNDGTTAFSFPQGSVTAPGLYVTGDTNTGFYQAAADTLSVTAGGKEIVRFDNASTANYVNYFNMAGSTTGNAITMSAAGSDTDVGITLAPKGVGALTLTSGATTGSGLAVNANSLTTGNGVSIASTSTAGGASGTSTALSVARSGANANTAHTAYGVYSTVTNTNATSGTNVAGYFSASGATTANYGLIVANGSVGIGTTAPVKPFDVRGDGILYSSNTSYSEGFNVFYTGSSVYGGGLNLHIGSAGTAPSASTMKAAFRLAGASSTVDSTALSTGDFYFDNYYSTTDHIAFTYSNSTNNLRIVPTTGVVGIGYTDLTGATGKLSVNGNVGIGTTSPGYLLDIAGSGSGILDSFRLRNTVAAANNSAAEMLFAANRTTGGLTNVAGVAGMITDITNGSYKGALVFSTANNAAPAERMRIDNNGYVGIGTSVPAGVLDVNGGTGPANTAGTNIRLIAQSASNWNSNGGSIYLVPGDGSPDNGALRGSVGIGTTAVTANTFFEVNGGGTGKSNAAGMDIRLTAQSAANYNSNGGNIYLSPGSGSPDNGGTRGSVGIGTTAVTANTFFEVNGGTGKSNAAGMDIKLVAQSAANYNSPGGNIFLMPGSGSPDNGSHQGYVGINTTTVNHVLDVYGNLGIKTSGYINFTSTDGTSGYGFRDNSGTMEYKNSGGGWTALSAGTATNFAAGSVGSPGLYVTGDTNTGFYQATADTLSVTAGGKEIVRFDNNAAANYVNYFNFAGSATGNAITMSAAGSDTDVGITVVPKGVGAVTLTSGATTGNGFVENANSLTTGTALSVVSTSTAGGASGTSYMIKSARSGANANTAHTAYGLYSTVTNTNATSGTNVAGYFSASGATTANYALQVAAGSTSLTAGTGITTGNAFDITANSITTGNVASLISTSTAGGASGASYMLKMARSGANSNTAHTAYGVYSTVTNTNATSGTNVAGYFSASGATTANYGLVVPSGWVGFGTATPTALFDVEGGKAANWTNGSDMKIVGQQGGDTGGGVATNGGNIFLIPGAFNGSGGVNGTYGSVAIGTTTFTPAGILDVEGGKAPDWLNGANIKLVAQQGGDTGGGVATNGGNILLVPGTFNGSGGVNGVAGSVAIGTYTSGPANGLAVSGSVSIGSTTANHKLDVNGNLGIATSGYINFTSTDGTSGYGLRDNSGTMEYKNSGGSWTSMSSGVSTNFAAGSVGSPGLYVTGDSNTGFYQAAADSLSITAGGKEIARFDNASTANYVNYFKFAGSIAGSAITESAAGSDTDIGITVVPKGVGAWTLTSGATTGDGLTVNANSLTTGNALDIVSTSTAGGASGASYVIKAARSGANANTAHTAYGVYSTVTNTNATSGTNVAGYFSASGATTANYGLVVPNGYVGIGTAAPSSLFHIYQSSSSIVEMLRLYNPDITGGSGEQIGFYGYNGNSRAAIVNTVTPGSGGATLAFQTSPDFSGASPTTRLTIADTGLVTVASTMDIGSNASFTGKRLRLLGYAATPGTDANLEVGDGTGTVYWRLARNGSNTFQTNMSAGWGIMGGNVGIGSLTPAATLDVASSATTGNAVAVVANSLTTGAVSNLTSTSTAGGASGVSYVEKITRSGANANTAHTAYGLYSTVTNTNATSGTNVAGYFSASGATTANYGLLVPGGYVGIGTATPAGPFEVQGGTTAATAAGSNITVVGQNGAGVWQTNAYAGGAVNITAGGGGTSGGSSTGSGGAGGAVTITAGTAGNGSQFSSAGGAGGAASLVGGVGSYGNTPGVGGTAALTGGAGGSSYETNAGTGGSVSITSGAGGSSAGSSGASGGASGAITIAVGAAGSGSQFGVGGAGGAITMTAGNASTSPSAGAAGGAITVTAGAGAGSSGGGAMTVTAGAGGATGAGGALTIKTGAGGSTSGSSGALTLGTGAKTSGSFGTISLTQGTNTRVLIDASGNVAIGTTTANHTLDVNGNLGLATSGYINFTSTDGTSGYGLRDNGGTMEYKNSGGAWTAISSGNATNFAAGSVGSPGLYVTGDTNTGFYQATADTLSVTAGGKEIARFDNNAAATYVNYFNFAGSATGNAITMSAAGSDTDVGITVAPKGVGALTLTSGATTGNGLVENANSLTTGTAMSVASTSTAGGASGASYLIKAVRSGANANTAHTAYGVYSDVSNTNATSGTNVAGYFSASGATTANYGVLVPNGYVGIGSSTPASPLVVQGNGASINSGNKVLDAYLANGTGVGFMGAKADATAFWVVGSSSSKKMALIAGTAGSAYVYDSAGSFSIVSEANSTVGDGGGTAQVTVAGGAPANSVSVNSSGYVGIGTTSAGAPLEVSSSGSPAAIFNRSANTNGFGVGLSFRLNNSSSAQKEYAHMGGGIVSNTAGAEGGFLGFYTTRAGATLNEGMRVDYTGNIGIGLTSPAALLNIGGSKSASSWTTTGLDFAVSANTLTDTSSAAAATVAVRAANSFGTPTLASTNAITVTDAATLYIAAPPTAGTNTTITNAWGLYIASGNANFGGNIHIATSGYINFTSTDGSGGYGIRDNSGTLEYKNSGGAWTAISSGNATNFAAGSVGSPGLYVTGDSNTGFYQAAADTLSITAGGKEIARFDNAATANFVNYFKFAGSATGNAITLSASGSDTDVGITITPKGAGNTIITSGSVGVGTATPATTLDVAGPIKVAGTGSETCDGTMVGAIRYNSGTGKMQVCK